MNARASENDLAISRSSSNRNYSAKLQGSENGRVVTIGSSSASKSVEIFMGNLVVITCNRGQGF